MTTLEIVQSLRADLQKAYEEEDLAHKIHLIIAETLKPLEGKKLTKRFTNKLTAAINAAKLFPTDPVCFYKHPGELALWHHPTRPFDQRLIFYIAHDFQPTNKSYAGHWVGESHVEGFEYSDQCHGEAAIQRNAERAQLLDANDPTLDSLAEKVLEVRRAWGALQSRLAPLSCGIHYAVEELTKLKER